MKKKYNTSAIMKRAWEIKKEDSRNIFSLCLVMAWKEAKMEAQKPSMKGTAKQVKWANDIIVKALKNAEDKQAKKIDRLTEIESLPENIESVRNSLKIQSALFRKIEECGDAALIINKRFAIESLSSDLAGDYMRQLLGKHGIETNVLLCGDSKTVYRGRIENHVGDSIIEMIASELANRLLNSDLR